PAAGHRALNPIYVPAGRRGDQPTGACMPVATVWPSRRASSPIVPTPPLAPAVPPRGPHRRRRGPPETPRRFSGFGVSYGLLMTSSISGKLVPVRGVEGGVSLYARAS